MMMPFGKFRGWDLRRIPDDSYIVWLLDRPDLRDPLRTAVRREAERRGFFVEEDDEPGHAVTRPCPFPRAAAEIVSSGLRALAMRHHPDRGGSTAVMQQINGAAEWLRAQLANAGDER
jgi:hypothetical protein